MKDDFFLLKKDLCNILRAKQYFFFHNSEGLKTVLKLRLSCKEHRSSVWKIRPKFRPKFRASFKLVPR